MAADPALATIRTLAAVVAPVTGTEIDLDDDELARVVRRAHLPPLLTALAHATGDLSILRPDLRCDPTRVRESQGGLTAEQREAARALAVDVLRRMRDRPEPDRAGTATDPDLLQQLMDFVIGERVADDYVHLLMEELALSGDDLRAPDWHKHAVDPDRAFLVVIVGAGMSGIAAAHRLQQAGVDYVQMPCTPLKVWQALQAAKAQRAAAE